MDQKFLINHVSYLLVFFVTLMNGALLFNWRCKDCFLFSFKRIVMKFGLFLCYILADW